MAIKRNTKIGLVVLAIIFGPMFYGCGRVEWKHSRVKPGMTVTQVLEVTDGWWACDGYSERAKPGASLGERPDPEVSPNGERRESGAAQHFWLTAGEGRYSMS